MRSMFPLHRVVSIIVLAALLSGCDAIKFWESDSGVGETVSTAQKEVLDVRNRATAIQSAIDRMDRRDLAPFTIGDTTLQVSMYFDAGRLRLIDERVEARQTGTARNRYYFEEESLFHFYGKSSQRLNPMEAQPQFAEVATRMYFNEAGNLFDYEHKINGLKSVMSENELPSVMQRSEALRMFAFTDVNGQIDTTRFVATLYNAKLPPAGTPGGQPEESAVDPAEETAAAETPAQDAAAAKVPPVSQNTQAQKQAPAPQPKQPVQKQAPVQQPKQPVQKQTPAPQPKQPVQKQTPAPPPPQSIAPPAEFAQAGDADAYIEAHTHGILPGTLITHRIRFQKGSTSASLSTRLKKGTHEEYVLRARRNQRMGVTLQSDNPDVYFRVFLRDGDISGQRRSWSGSLPRYGDYHVVAYIRGGAAVNGEVPCTLTISIE